MTGSHGSLSHDELLYKIDNISSVDFNPCLGEIYNDDHVIRHDDSAISANSDSPDHNVRTDAMS